MRYIAPLLVIVVGTVTGALAYHDFSLALPVVLSAPSGPQVTPTVTSVLPNACTSATGSDIAGYSYRLDSDGKGEARAELRTQQPSVTLSGLETGQWYIHVRALDHAGNWGPSHTFPVHIDVTPPGLAHVRFSLFKF